MSSCSFAYVVTGENARKVVQKEMEDARCEYGSDPYNGTISTCDYTGNVDLGFAGKKFKESNIKKADKKVDEMLKKYLSKRDCKTINLGVDHYELVTFKKVKIKGSIKAPKPKLVYKVLGFKEQFETEAKALEFAMEVALDNGINVKIQKAYEIPTTSYTSTELQTVVKVLNRAPKRIPKNAKLRTINKYYVFGWAAE